jgi:hypothetical protein
MAQQELIQQINKELSIDLSEQINEQQLISQLETYVNQLIVHHFEQLVSLLYRIDVSENKITQVLQQQAGEDAAKLITRLIIERQLQKVASRKQYTRKFPEADDEEKW